MALLLEDMSFKSHTFIFKKNRFCLVQWKPFKNDEKGFLFHVKSSFRSWDIYIFVLIRKLWLIFKSMMSQTGQQIITMHILPNISRSKGNQSIKFGQLTEYDMRKIFLEKSYTKCSREASLRNFYKKSKLSIKFLDQQSEMLWSLFWLYVQVEVYQSILKLRCWPLAFTLYKAFLKNKKRSGASLSTHFLHDF